MRRNSQKITEINERKTNMTHQKIKPSFDRKRYADTCIANGDKWLSANPDIKYLLGDTTSSDPEKALLNLHIDRYDNQLRSCRVVVHGCLMSFIVLAIFLIARAFNNLAINIPAMSALFFALLFSILLFSCAEYWFSNKDKFYALYSDEVENFVKDTQQSLLKLQSRTACTKLSREEEHHSDARN